MNKIIDIKELKSIKDRLMIVAFNINAISSPEFVNPGNILSIERTRIRMMRKALIDTGLINDDKDLSDDYIEHKFYRWVI